ncbi:MAG: yabN [Chlamydiales bacterium]|jgi:tetrapyrrole methylase family protein/MazG family protein|nr:yabN [Chlamydiales bacterium]
MSSFSPHFYQALKDLCQVVDRLFAPGGCPWDIAQTFQSIRHSILEETCEFLEAVHLNDNAHIAEELGDLLFNVLFFAKLGEKENRFSPEEMVSAITEKLVRRHPHVFGSATVEDAAEVLKNWEKIKAEEKKERCSLFDGIPKELPALSRAQKMLKKVTKNDPSFMVEESSSLESEESIAHALASLSLKAASLGVDAEQALNAYLARLERDVRQKEQTT